MKVIVFGATGGTGREAVQALVDAGHRVTAFSRRPDPEGLPSGVDVAVGDVMDAPRVEAAVEGHDAVVVALGIRENPLLVRLRGASGTATRVRSEGTRNIMRAMSAHGIRRLVVQSTFGVGATRGRLTLAWRLIFWLLLRPQIRDTEVQEALVRASDLDWTLAQPVSLTDGEARSMKVPRRSVARFLADAVSSAGLVRRSVALSA